jgi:Ribonuclease HII
MQKENHLLPYMDESRIEAGCDEAGRGPLAGPVYAAAVILPKDFNHPLLNDSKKMSEKERNLLRPIIEKEAIAWAVEAVSPAEIDELNILWASVTGMQRAVRRLSVKPDHLLIDGNRFRPFDGYGASDYSMVVHGDATYASIAAASVLAKTYRDEEMRRLAKLFPEYGWERNFGYPTKEHIRAIKEYGWTPHHRMSFHPKNWSPASSEDQSMQTRQMNIQKRKKRKA